MHASSAETDVVGFDGDATRKHALLLHELSQGHSGKFVICAFHEDQPGTITHHSVGNVDEMVEAIQAHTNTPGANVYSGLHLMRPNLPRGQRGKESDIVAVLGLVADMDSDTGKIGEMPVEPSYVVETSPSNYQAAILLDKPMAPADAKRLAKALQRATGADFGTGDITHIWRIAGTLNC